MRDGIEREPALQSCRVVSELPGRPRVGELMKRQEYYQTQIKNQAVNNVVCIHWRQLILSAAASRGCEFSLRAAKMF
jgi:hypothetical protein